MRQGVFTPKLKLLWHRKQIDQWINGENNPPIMVEFDLTNRCQLKCSFCTFDYIKDKSDIDTNAVLRAIDDFQSMGVKSINFTGGGEPTLHKDFNLIIQAASTRGIDVGVFTNGHNLHYDTIETMLKHCRWVRVSVDAGSEETFKKIKGVPGYNKTLNNIRHLVNAKKELNSNTTVGIGFVICPDNVLDIYSFSSASKDLGVDYAQYKPMIKNCFSGSQIESEWWDKEVRPRLEKVMEANEKAVINLYKFNDLTSHIEREYGECYGHNFVPCIGATGDVWICTHLRNISGFSFGNINKESFQSIWEGRRRRSVASAIDLSKCQLYCRNNEINKVLWALKQNSKEGHYNFI